MIWKPWLFISPMIVKTKNELFFVVYIFGLRGIVRSLVVAIVKVHNV
jgi:hypothetical protein